MFSCRRAYLLLETWEGRRHLRDTVRTYIIAVVPRTAVDPIGEPVYAFGAPNRLFLLESSRQRKPKRTVNKKKAKSSQVPEQELGGQEAAKTSFKAVAGRACKYSMPSKKQLRQLKGC